MVTGDELAWVDAAAETIASYRRMIDAAVAQLSDDELMELPAGGINSVATVLRHLGGNLQSRWTSFLTTDGEKPDRNRDNEFQPWTQGRSELLAYFDAGWSALEQAVATIRTLAEKGTASSQRILIRGEEHTLAQALFRSVTHLSYHAGQIMMVARMVHQGEWKWLTVAPGRSADHNATTWGTSASRSIFAEEERP